MIRSIKVRLNPNNKQLTKLFQYSDCARFAYNWAIATERESYKLNGEFLSDCDLRKRFTQLKKQPDYLWLNDVSGDVPKQAIKDACGAYKRFFKGNGKRPKFKSRKKCTPSFYQDNVKIKFTGTHVKVEKFSTSQRQNKKKFNWIRLCEKNRIPINCAYMNPRFTFDGLYWYVSVGIEVENDVDGLFNEGIGIDLGIKDFAICSDGVVYENINKTSRVKKIEKRRHRLQRSVSRKYEKNKISGRYCKTNNIKKQENKLLKITKRLTNIRNNNLHQTTSEIVKNKPSYITIEDLDVSDMMKNRYLSKSVQEQGFYEFRRQLTYKCEYEGIRLVVAYRFFPSSKLCSHCGNIKKDLKLSDRIYVCKKCGNTINRDFQAALNLKLYGKNILKSI